MHLQASDLGVGQASLWCVWVKYIDLVSLAALHGTNAGTCRDTYACTTYLATGIQQQASTHTIGSYSVARQRCACRAWRGSR